MTVRRLDRTPVPVTYFEYVRAVTDSRRLSSSERLVALAIARHAGTDGSKAHPGNNLLASETGLYIRTIERATKSLRAAGYLTLTFSGRGGRGDRANEYDLSVPAWTVTTKDVKPSQEHFDDIPNKVKPSQATSQTVTGTGQTVTSSGTDAFDSDAPRDAPDAARENQDQSQRRISVTRDVRYQVRALTRREKKRSWLLPQEDLQLPQGTG